MNSVEFSEGYYKDVITANGYDSSVFEGFRENLQSIGREELEQIFLCHTGLYEFRDATTPQAVLTGFGLSGTPHLGTLSQMHRAALLNRAGYHTELILGDLDAYNGKRTPFEQVRELSAFYRRFIEESGLMDETNSRVRNQYDFPEVLRTAYMVGRYATDALFEGANEDLHELYAAEGKVDATMSYPRKLSLNLMIADFIHLGQTYPNVLVMLGLDEHQYVRAAQQLGRAIDPNDPAFAPVRINALYTPMIKGLRGFPKMSKSFPESSIHLGMSADAIREAIVSEPDSFGTAADSVVYQIACGVGTEDNMPLTEVRTAAEERGTAWQDVKRAVIARIAGFAGLWQEVARP